MALSIKSSNRANVHKEQAIKEITAEKIVKLTINIPKSMHSEFKIAAIRNSTDMTDLVLNWIKQYIQK
jgi:hypothetical protein